MAERFWDCRAWWRR